MVPNLNPTPNLNPNLNPPPNQADERCGGLGWSRVAVGAILGAYIIVYGQCQSWTPQLVLQPLGQSPPNKQTEILWGVINCIPTAVMAAVCYVLLYNRVDGLKTRC